MTYQTFRTEAQARKAFKGVRTVKHFIIEGEGKSWNPTCKCCKRKVFDFSGTDTEGKPMHPKGFDGNRCEYNPKTKVITARHYTCAWGKVLDTIATLKRAS